MTTKVVRFSVLVGFLAACSGGAMGRGPASGGEGTEVSESSPAANSPRYLVRVLDASLAGRRPDGTVWHTSQPDRLAVVAGGAVGALLGQAELGMEAGKLIAGDAQDFPPMPYVELRIHGQRYATSPSEPSLAPTWNEELAVDVQGYRPDEQLALLVRDGVDDAVLAQQRMTLAELVSKSHHSLYDLGSVSTLDFDVEPLPAAVPRRIRIWVPGSIGVRDLEAGAADDVGWRSVPLVAGDIVSISASGSVCPFRTDRCVGPAGVDVSRFVGSFIALQLGPAPNYSEFADGAHADLVGVFGGRAFRAGESKTFRAHVSGDLLLFVNDADPSNNRGAFVVDVRVNGG